MAHDSGYRKRVEFERFREKIEAAEGSGPSLKPKNLQAVPAQLLITKGYARA